MRSLQPPSWVVSLGFAMTVLLTKKSILSNLCSFQVPKLKVFDLFPLEFRIPSHINWLHSVSSDYSWRFSPRYLLPLVPWRKLKSLSRCVRPQPWTSLLSWIELICVSILVIRSFGLVNETFSGGLSFGIVNLFALLTLYECQWNTQGSHKTNLLRMAAKSQHKIDKSYYKGLSPNYLY